MYTRQECIAMLLAGGQGSRLGVLTGELAKPAVPFGGKYRIIDFTLSNCINSGIETVGVLTQYQPHALNAYIGNGRPWGLDRMRGGVQVLPPYVRGKAGEWYKGTANAIFQNIAFVERFGPKDVVVLSGDHIYKMDYSDMLQFHQETDAACTIAVMEVPMEDASRFGIMSAGPDGTIYEFDEKPKKPKSNKASMGVYVFNWQKLKDYLEMDNATPGSSNDFGKNIIPAMLAAGERMLAYPFKGYWKDVGTIESLWDANMDLLDPAVDLSLDDPRWKIYSRNPIEPPAFIGASAVVHNSMVTEGAIIHGEIEGSIIFHSAYIGEGARVENSIVMPGARVESGSLVSYAILAAGSQVERGAIVKGAKGKIAVVGSGRVVGAGAMVGPGESVSEDIPAK